MSGRIMKRVRRIILSGMLIVGVGTGTIATTALVEASMAVPASADTLTNCYPYGWGSMCYDNVTWWEWLMGENSGWHYYPYYTT